MKSGSQKGSVLVGILVALGLGAFIYVSNSTGFFKTITKQKSKNQLDVMSKSLTNAIFNYTAYAIKERWCMDENWGRDKDCGSPGGSDMKTVITHNRNLERFLWSKVTTNDMSIRYQKLYGNAPTQQIGLTFLEQNISMSMLESLGNSHPLNLVMDDNIKKCLTSVTIKIEKPLASFYKPQGDEVYLLISVKGNLTKNPFASCALIRQSPMLKGLVIVYPKTLNQYALVKAEDFKISDFGNSSKGLNFFGPVYVQKNLVLPSSGKYGISFKEKVRIGEGILQSEGSAFVPQTPGGNSDQFLSQITTMNGFMNGISLEAEVDAGLPRLFGGSYTYPTNVNMGDCTNRKALKDNYSLTKNSRVWARGSGGLYTFILSESNEFREYIRHGINEKGFYVYNTYLPDFTNATGSRKNQFDVTMPKATDKDKPIMEVYISVEGKEYSKVYLGRDSEAKISFGNTVFYQQQLDTIDISDTSYLDFNKVDSNGMGIDSTFSNTYAAFKNSCADNKSYSYTYPICAKVDPTSSGAIPTNCSLLPNPSEKVNCLTKLSELDIAKNKYFQEQATLISNLKDFIGSTPGVILKTGAQLSNKEDVHIDFINKSSFKYPFVADINSIKFRFNIYDFAIEESNNTLSGLRAGKNKRMPGPNEAGTGNENIIDFKFFRSKDFYLNKIEAQKSDGSNLDAAISSGWGIVKVENKAYNNSEPPGNYPSNPSINLPTDGLSVAAAAELDKSCEIDTNAIPPASWDVSFTEHTQFSWLYNVTNPGITIVNPSQVQPMPTYTFTTLDMDVGNYQGVPTRSIVKDCIVPSSLNFVFGFYVCENLIIKSRAQPLNMVGTYIVKNLKIDNTALSAGVNFYSIWSSGGIQLLRDKGHLRREKHSSPACSFTVPGWYSGIDEDTMADYQSCSPAKFLYQGANNFNWTMIDPEIGITNSGTQVTTQSKVVNRYRRFGTNVIWLRNGVE